MRLWLPVGALLASVLGLSWLGDLLRRPGPFLILWSLACIAWLVAARGARRFPPSAAAALVVAAAMRLLLLPLEPVLSSDVWRYLWEGEVVLAGADPYRLAPDAPELASLRPGGPWERVEHRDVPAVYPPAALGLFSISAATPWPLAAWKAIVLAADLACCWALVLLARREGLPAHRPLLYLWCPLPALEGVGMGHLDAVAVGAAVLAVLALRAGRERLAAVAAAAGVLLKLAPGAAWPLWTRAASRRGRFLATAAPLVAVGVLPMLRHGLPGGLATYAVHWEHGGPLFEPLWRLLAALRVGPGLAALVAWLEESLGAPRLLDGVYPWLYPQLLAKAALALLAGWFVWRSLAWAAQPGAATGSLFGRLLLCSATLYPWYLLWVLPWAALSGRRSWLWAAVAAPLLYAPALFGWSLWPWPFVLLWVPFWLVRRHEGPWLTSTA